MVANVVMTDETPSYQYPIVNSPMKKKNGKGDSDMASSPRRGTYITYYGLACYDEEGLHIQGR